MIPAVVSFFHLYWMLNRERWKTIFIMLKNCFETSAGWVHTKSPFRSIILSDNWFDQFSNIVAISQWWLTMEREKLSHTVSIPVVHCFWCQLADSFKRFWLRVRSLSSVGVKSTGWSSSFVLYASSLATTVTSQCAKSVLYSMLTSGSGIGRSDWRNVGGMTCFLFLWFIPFSADIAVTYIIFSFHWNRNKVLLPFLQSLKFSTRVLQQM